MSLLQLSQFTTHGLKKDQRPKIVHKESLAYMNWHKLSWMQPAHIVQVAEEEFRKMHGPKVSK